MSIDLIRLGVKDEENKRNLEMFTLCKNIYNKSRFSKMSNLQ